MATKNEIENNMVFEKDENETDSFLIDNNAPNTCTTISPQNISTSSKESPSSIVNLVSLGDKCSPATSLASSAEDSVSSLTFSCSQQKHTSNDNTHCSIPVCEGVTIDISRARIVGADKLRAHNINEFPPGTFRSGLCTILVNVSKDKKCTACDDLNKVINDKRRGEYLF